ncbi:hypothetical protein AgCh_018213 [Apium graveolens]
MMSQKDIKLGDTDYKNEEHELTDQKASTNKAESSIFKSPVIIILELVDKLPIEAVLEHIIKVPGQRGSENGLKKVSELGNPGVLLLALKMCVKISIDNEIFGKLLPNPCNSGKFLFSPASFQLFSNLLKQSTFCQPSVHNIWPPFLDILLPNVVLKDADTA